MSRKSSSSACRALVPLLSHCPDEFDHYAGDSRPVATHPEVGNAMLDDTTTQTAVPAQRGERRIRARTASDAEQAVGKVTANIRHILRGGFYRVGQEIPIEQLGADANASLPVVRCAAFRLHHQGLFELVVSAPEMTPVERVHGHARARVALRLREGIALGVYPQGSVLPTQLALARSFGVSKATVGNALEALSAEGWLEREPRRAPTASRPAREICSVRVVAAPL